MKSLRWITLSWLVLVCSAFAQQAPDKANIRAFILQMLERDLAIQQIAALQKAGYIPEEIDRITQSEPFQRYLKQVIHTDRITKSIDRKLDQILKPGYLEDRIRQSVERARSQQREDLVLALRELERTRTRPSKNLDNPEPSFFSKILEKFKKQLFG